MFATLCSNPAAMKANRHQNIMMSLPESLLARKIRVNAVRRGKARPSPGSYEGVRGM
jgi:hypothetical protein